MALRRKLPSRSLPETGPDSAATPAAAPATASNPPRSSNSAPRNPVQSAPANPPANPFGDAVLPEPVTPLVVETTTFAAAATSAFSTLPTAPAGAPARVLEDSFTKPAAPTETITPEPAFVAPAWQAPEPAATAPEPAPAPEPEFVAPAWQTPQPAAVAAPVPEPEPVTEPVLAPAPVSAAPMPQAPEPTPLPAPAPIVPEPASPAPVISAPVIPVFAAPEVPPVAAPQIQPAPQPQSSPEPQAAQTFEPSRPDAGQIRRRVREKRPRDFNAMGSPENAAPERPKPMTAFAPNVPVDTRPLDQVNEDLIAGGIMAGPAADSLTANLPTGLAEMTFTPPVQPERAPQPTPAPAPTPAPVVAQPIPVAVPPAPLPQPAAEPKPEFKPEIRPEPNPEPAPAPQPVAQFIPVSIPIPVPQPAQPAPATPAFNLSNTPAAAPLPPPQSDLPWTQPAPAAAEWEIEAPVGAGWSPETGHDTPGAGPSPAHLPPPADLYKPMGAASAAPLPPLGAMGGGIPPRGTTNFTPELPGQRRKSSGGTPWALIAVGALVVVGGGAWYLRNGGAGQAQQQLASLTTPASGTQVAAVAPPDMLQPPRTDNASFYTPPLPATANTSSSAVVNFADVPPEQANQPIVADGKEEIPQSLFGKFKTEVEKARARKEAGLPADPSATAPTATADATTYTPEKFQEEMAAYRSALAQSANPAALKPSTFLKDPDGYMDGKSQVTQPVASANPATNADGTPMASGALLPPPSAASALPPPELYTNNPKHLPVVAEPIANAPARVRTLADFPDIEPYAPEKEKVEIPKNLKPKMAATDFPSLEVLSFVPDKGIVAFADGREGVLLIGESINGWTLVGVSPDHAEFKTGEKSYQVTADNQ